MKTAFVVCLLLQTVFAAGRNVSISISGPKESPAGVTYVEGKAPEDLKAGPVKNTPKPKEIFAQAAFIRSGSRDIPKDDEVQNEEFERFIKQHHNRPTIETVFVSSSPSPLYDEEAEEFNEESSSLRSQAEFFKQPAKNQTFERSVALPTIASSIHPALDHGHGHLDLAGGISYGGDGIIVQGDGGGYSTIVNGHYLPGYQGIYGGGEQQFIQVSQPVPSGVPAVVAVPSSVPRTINVAQHALKTKTYEIRRPAIQKHYYDIEERVIIRPAGSIVVELDRPVAKIPTGETVVALGGGGFTGIQQSQGAIGITQGGAQGGLSGIGIQQSQGGLGGLQGAIGISQGGLQGGLAGIGIQQSQDGLSSSGPFYIIGGPQGGVYDLGFQQTQGGIAISQGGAQGGLSGIGIQQSQGGVTSTTASFPAGGPQGNIPGLGTQQSQGGIAISQGGAQGGLSGIGIQQSQGGVTSTTASFPAGGPQGNIPGLGTQQSQGGIAISQGGAQGGLSGIGIQQSQGGVTSTTASFPAGGPQGNIPGLGTQQSQGGIAISQGGGQGGLSGIGIQQSQGGVTSTTPAFPGGGQQGGVPGAGFQQSQGAIGVSQGGPQGGLSGIGIQQSQGGVTSTIPSFTVGGPQGGVPGSGFQQSQGAIGVSQGGPQGGFIGTGFQQAPGGTIYSTTLTSYNPFANPTISTVFGGQGTTSQGGLSYSTSFATPPSSINIGGGGGQFGSGFQQSQGAIGVSTGGPQGGASGVGIQQSQGGGIFSTTSAPYLPPVSPTPTVLIGSGFQQTTTASSIGIGGAPGVGFQQSQGAVGVTTVGPQGGLAGVGIQQSQSGGIYSTTPGPYLPPVSPTTPFGIGSGFQQSQGAIGVSQGGQSGIGIQQSQGGIASSTTPLPFLPPSYPTYHPSPRPSRPYPLISSTTASSINDDDSVVVEASANVRNRGSFSTTTTTERSFTVNRDASAFARGSSSGSVQAVSKNITPFMIAVGEPDFHYPPYVEINSNGSPLGHLQLVPATSQTYPRMRYQGKLLTGEVRIGEDSQQSGYGALAHQKIYETPVYVAEIPPNTPNAQEAALHHHADSQYQRQYVGSTQQPLQISQVSGNAHQQPAQVYRNHFIGTTSRPITITDHKYEGGHPSGGHQIQIAKYSQPAQVYQISQQPIPEAPVHQENDRSRFPQRTNLVAQIRHQQQESAQFRNNALQQQQQDAQVHGSTTHQQQNLAQINQQHIPEVTEQPIKAEIGGSTLRQYSEQPSHPNLQYQGGSTTLQPETFTTGKRLYQQISTPSKYTQHHTINVAPSQHSIFFSSHPQQAELSVRSQKLLETPAEPEGTAEPTTAASVISSTTARQAEDVAQQPHQTYASVLANSQPGILYAPVPRHHPSHPQHSLSFSSEGSSLFSPSGRRLHLVYSQPSVSHQSPSNPITSAESGRHHISLTNEGLQAQIPLKHQKQIQLSASTANNPQQSAPQSQHTARYESISSTTPASDAVSTTEVLQQPRRQQKYRNEQTRGAITLRSGRTYGDHRVIASTPAPRDGGAASESVQTRRIVVNHPFQTVQEVVEQEPITKYQQITVNEPAKAHSDGLQQDQQKASYRQPAAAYKVAATYDHPAAAVSYRHSGSH